MAKKGQKKSSRDDKLRQQLAKAQAALQQAQDKRAQVTRKGEQDVELARKRAAERLTKATQRVERRAKVVSRIEAEILDIHAPPAPRPVEPASPMAAAATLEQIQGAADDHRPDSLVTAESAEEVAEIQRVEPPRD